MTETGIPLRAAHPWRELFTSTVTLRWGQHVITTILLLIVVLRSLTSSPATVGPVIAAVIAFAACYVVGFVISLRATAGGTNLWLLALILIWLGSLWVSPEFMWLAFSLWLLLGHQLPLLPSILWSLVVYALAVVSPYLHQGTNTVAGVMGPLVGGIFAWGISRGYLQLERDAEERSALVDSLVRAQQEMTELQDELARSQHQAGVDTERTRLAREIHDTIAQQLSSIGLHAKAGITSSNPADTVIALQRIDELAGRSLTDLRRIIAALAPAELDSQALSGALERILADFSEDSQVTTRIYIEPGLPSLEPALQVALLRTAQSALTNVLRHAQATHLALSLVDDGDGIRLDIVDDGIGFDPKERALRTPQRLASGGYGLAAMRQRLRELGGELDIESAPGEGTALSAHIPLFYSEVSK